MRSERREVQTKFVVAGRLFGEEPIIVRGHSDLNAKTNACACMLLLVACWRIRFNFLQDRIWITRVALKP